MNNEVTDYSGKDLFRYGRNISPNLMIKFTVISEKAISPLGNLAKLEFWSILSLKN